MSSSAGAASETIPIEIAMQQHVGFDMEIELFVLKPTVSA